MSDTRVSVRPYMVGPAATHFVVPAGGSPYSGPGDVASLPAAIGWYGLRAYKNSNIGSNIVRLKYNDATTINYAAQSDGGLPLSTISADTTTHGAPVVMDLLYNQSGGVMGNMGSEGAIAFTLSGLGTKPVVTFDPAQVLGFQTGALGSTFNEPVALYVLAKSTFSGIASGGALCTVGTGVETSYTRHVTDNTMQIVGTTGADYTVSDGNWHFSICHFNGASSQLYLDGVGQGVQSTTSNRGFQSGDIPLIGRDGFSNYWKGPACEWGFFASDLTSFQAALYSNVIGYYGALP